MPVDLISTFDEELRAIRRQLHAYPELGFEEEQTSALVAQKLTEWGYDVHRGIGKTGVVGSLSHGTGKKRIGLRADMDALPIEENTGKAWASRNPGVMHACGHDGHTTILLGAARYLSKTRQFNGTVHLIFQPAEEGRGGGEAMVKQGLFQRFPCDVIYGMHNMPGAPIGQLSFRAGPFLASVDHYRVTVHGKGGHGALPHLAIDPVMATASIITALQTIVSRTIVAGEKVVISVGAIHGGVAFNVIPDSVTMELSVRTFSAAMRQEVEQRIRHIVRVQAESFGASASVEHVNGMPVTVTGEAATIFAAEVARQLFGDRNVVYGADPLMSSEDFSYMLEANPNGSYFFFGMGEDACPVHNPGYDFNDDIIVPAAAMWAALVERYLE